MGHPLRPNRPDPRLFAAAPTRDQAKRIWWEDLKRLVPRAWIKSPHGILESDLCIRFEWGGELWVIGLDKPERMEGVPWDGGVIDEIASGKAGLWEANLRPALSTAGRLGWCWLIGVPDFAGPAQADYEKLFDLAASNTDPEWAAYSWPSSDIVPAAEVESAKRTMDPRMFIQEFGGKFVLAGGRAFPDFDVKTHVKETPYDPALPLCWSLDFNINPQCSGVIQHHKWHVRIIHEFSLADTRTETVCDSFMAWVLSRGINLDTGLYVYGDPSGTARDTTSGVSDWTIIRNALKNLKNFKNRVPTSHAPIKDTVNAVNARVKSADGAIHLSIDPHCKGIISDMKAALAGTDMEPQHHVSWLRYFCHQEFPVRSDTVRKSTGQVVFNSST